jgi:hypothetical protein
MLIFFFFHFFKIKILVTWHQIDIVPPVRHHPIGDVPAGQTSPMGIGNMHHPNSSCSLFFLPPQALPFSFFSFSLCALTTSIPPMPAPSYLKWKEEKENEKIR